MSPAKPDKQDKTNLVLRLETLIEELSELHGDLRQSLKIGIDCSSDGSKSSLFKARLSRIDSTYDKFNSVLREVRLLSRQVEDFDCTHYDGMAIDAREVYYEALSLDIHENCSPNISAHAEPSLGRVNGQLHLRLPPIKLPSFGGDIADWAVFRDTYASLIHQNAELPNIQKFHYLKSSLKGAAAQLIATIPISDAEYEHAWATLTKRYDNKRTQATSFLMKMFNFKPFHKQTLDTLENFSNIFLENATSFTTVQLEDPIGFILLTYGLTLLDPLTVDQFEAKLNLRSDDSVPTFAEFQNFIEETCIKLQTKSMTSSRIHDAISKHTQGSRRVMMSTDSFSRTECFYCQQAHRIYECNQFRSLQPRKRLEKIRALRRCENCLSLGHYASRCPSQNTCRSCNRKHHTLLHILPDPDRARETVQGNNSHIAKASSSSVPTTVLSPSPKDTDKVLSSAVDGEVYVLLGTACARIKDRDGNYNYIRMLIDSGSQRSFITASCAHRLGLPSSRNLSNISGFANSPIPGGKYQVKCTLIPKTRTQPQLETSAVIIPQITEGLPMNLVSPKIRDLFRNYTLADPRFDQPNRIDFLLGADLFSQIITGDMVHTPVGFPDGLGTLFGLVITGPVQASTSTTLALLAEDKPTLTKPLDALLCKFWDMEEVDHPHYTSTEDLKVEDLFVNTHYRDAEGRYSVGLPFKELAPDLGDSHHIAVHRFRLLEKKLERFPAMKAEYSQILREYLEIGIITNAQKPGKYFLPHHPVFKGDSHKKMRIVFDASSQANSRSLNDHLHAGPKLQSDIFTVLLNFRLKTYALTADIRKMFLQIAIHPEDQDFLHFVYRFETEEALQEYQFTRLPFGLTCSPFLALRVLRQLVTDEGQKFPLASKALSENIYVDDILTGTDDYEELRKLQEELLILLKKGGFELGRWSTNYPTYELPGIDLIENCSLSLIKPEESSVPVLGLQWRIQDDCFTYRVHSPDSGVTKRKVMSVIARLYDPLGYLAPVIFKAKSVLQELWRRKVDWDSTLPPDMATIWHTFLSQLSYIQRIQIPRHLFPGTGYRNRIIGFADASVLGYAAVVYLRSENHDGTIVSSKLLLAKTRLAPVKFLTIPRLELCAALLLVRTLKSLESFLKPLNVDSTTLLSDSMIVLHWLRIPTSKLKTFVAHRIAKILEETSLEQWHHVKSSDNAADLASRGTDPQNLLHETQWWSGPEWLMKNPYDWPISNQFSLDETDSIMEVKNTVFLTTSSDPPFILDNISRFSSLSSAINSWAYVLRFIKNTKVAREKRNSESISLLEARRALQVLVKATQNFHFADEYPWITVKDVSLKTLTPFVDRYGVVRVGGRLANSSLPFDQKHPILLPAKAQLTALLIDHWHQCHQHAGPQLLHSLLRNRYWILGARKAIKSRIRKCITCKRFTTKPFQPLMGNLPSSRFQQGRAFLNTGVDFAGPFSIRDSLRRKFNLSKCYLCLYICFGTKAIHCEVVSDMTMEAFLACLDRFIARRGLPSHIFSDNGRNFLGASNHLKELYAWWRTRETQKRLDDYLRAKEIKWSFIPPHAPHFGGLWEAGVKSMKYHLRRVLTSQALTYEEFATITCRIEALLNSRPLYPLSSEPEDYEVLTPGHFLIGSSLLSPPELNFLDTPDNRLSRWQLLHKCIGDIWRRWKKDYLHNLQQKVKWTSHQPGPEEGDLVLIYDRDTQPQNWTTARILQVYPGKDGVTRVAKLRTAQGEAIRAVTSLAPLLSSDND